MSKAHDIEIVKTDLQIKEELDAHRRGWTAQRVGLTLMYLLVIAAAVGLFGDGLASAKTESSQQITVESERFYRFQAPMPLQIMVTNTSGSNITIAFPNDYFRHFEVRSIVPEPTENEFINDHVHYTFDATGDADITFYLIPLERGRIRGVLNVNDEQFQLNHFIFP